MRILLIQGANMTHLGKRQPAIYGTTTAAELDAMLQAHAAAKGCHLDIFYANHEGAAIERVYAAAGGVAAGGVDRADGLLMNPAGFSYAGHALRDCVTGSGLPYVEVHMSNVEARGIHSVLAQAARGVIFGFGLQSYVLGLEALLTMLEHDAAAVKSAGLVRGARLIARN